MLVVGGVRGVADLLRQMGGDKVFEPDQATPHTITIKTFGGCNWSDQDWTITDVKINAPIDPALFKRPAS